MQRWFGILFGAVLLLWVGLPAAPAQAAGPQWVVVQYGDTLAGIASRYNTSVTLLVQANKLPTPNLVYAGQRLIIPANTAPAPPPPASVAGPTVYEVRAGDQIQTLAARFGVTVDALQRANSTFNLRVLYPGQRLVIPAPAAPKPPTPAPAPPAASVLAPGPLPPNAPREGRWIDVNLKRQIITAYEGTKAVKTVKVSTGTSVYPTPVGRYKIYVKYPSQLMTGGSRAAGTYYYLPNVPSVMYFFKGYAIHGTYWHNNFGRPMSHGCVNLTIADAKWFYTWASIGTEVITHY